MAKRSLARHWKKRSSEEKKEFVDIFSDLLERSYIGKIEGYTDEKVNYDKEVLKGKGKYGVVNTTIVTKDVNIPIFYKVRYKNNKWWIYDVVVEGVSFISTYRSQYNKVITRESYAKLIGKMKTKLNSVNEFHKVFKIGDAPKEPTLIPFKDYRLRFELMKEENEECYFCDRRSYCFRVCHLRDVLGG